MIEIEINKKNLEKFILNIRQKDKEELEFTFKNNWRENFIEICLKEKYIWFLADKNSIPCAIGGIQHEGNFNNSSIGRIWLICANNFKENSIAVLKYVKHKIEIFKKDNDVLYNYIYKSNFSFLKWLKLIGFKTSVINNDIILFYYTKEENFDTRYFTCK